LELFGNPDERAVDHGTVIAGQVHNARLDDETAEFDQIWGALAALDLPVAHVMPRPRRLMPVARRPVASERRCCRCQMPLQIAAICRERTQRRAWPMPPSSRYLRFRPTRSAHPPVR